MRNISIFLSIWVPFKAIYLRQKYNFSRNALLFIDIPSRIPINVNALVLLSHPDNLHNQVHLRVVQGITCKQRPACINHGQRLVWAWRERKGQKPTVIMHIWSYEHTRIDEDDTNYRVKVNWKVLPWNKTRSRVQKGVDFTELKLIVSIVTTILSN